MRYEKQINYCCYMLIINDITVCGIVDVFFFIIPCIARYYFCYYICDTKILGVKIYLCN